tara:strand:+ start:31994 stop:32179 length:186 start_codon:yes stop_codon:yes gene_type:complete
MENKNYELPIFDVAYNMTVVHAPNPWEKVEHPGWKPREKPKYHLFEPTKYDLNFGPRVPYR